MASLENITSPEIDEKPDNKQENTQPPFNSIEQKLKGCVSLANKEYKTKFGKDLPEEIKNLLPQALNGKDEQERDEILDDITDIIQNSDNVDYDLKNNLNKLAGNQTKNQAEQTENSNEQTQNQDKQNKTEKDKELAMKEENFDNLANSLSNLNGTGTNYNHILERIKSLKTLVAEKGLNAEFDTEIKDILKELNDPQTLLSVSLDLQAQGQQNGTHTFETFKTAIINLDPSFKDKFPQAETKAMLALGTDNLKNTQTTNNGYTQTTDDGFTTSATLDGRERAIGRTDSNYRLKSDLNTATAQKEADKIANDLAEALKPIDQNLKTIKTMKAYLEEAKRQDTPLETVKNELQALDPELYNKLGLAFSNSPDELLHTLTSHETELTSKKAELQAQADKARAKLISNQKEKAKEKDEIKKEVLNFLHQIGFDAIPQEVTDTIIANINASSNTYGLHKSISPENGSLGFDSDLGNKNISNGEKQKFIELYNKMLTGSREHPVKLINGEIIFYDNLENARAGISTGFTFDIGEFANRSLGSEPVVRAMMNLEKGEDKEEK